MPPCESTDEGVGAADARIYTGVIKKALQDCGVPASCSSEQSSVLADRWISSRISQQHIQTLEAASASCKDDRCFGTLSSCALCTFGHDSGTLLAGSAVPRSVRATRVLYLLMCRRHAGCQVSLLILEHRLHLQA